MNTEETPRLDTYVGTKLADDLYNVCDACETPLNDEEAETPYARNGLVWCDRCYREEFEFLCSWCEEYGDVEDQHRYVAVFDAEEAGLALEGFYRVIETRYYTQAMIGCGWLHPRALRWWGHLPPGLEEPDGYPVGHFCGGCQQRMLEQIATQQGIIHDSW
jgi:hypothetical protein